MYYFNTIRGTAKIHVLRLKTTRLRIWSIRRSRMNSRCRTPRFLHTTLDEKGRQSLFLVQDVTNVYTHISLERDEEREKKRERQREREEFPLASGKECSAWRISVKSVCN